MMDNDMDLLRDYAANRSDEAFETLVSRHVSLVYSSALRQVRNPHQAEEITQAVFMILARKAGSLSRNTILPGWLYRTTRFTAANMMRAEASRSRREQEAYMQSTTEEHPTESVWHELSPLLDEAMERLRPSDRDALVLRFFENKNLQEVGAVLGLEERAAQKRVSRSLDKLRAILTKRGVALSAAALAATLSANSIHATPAGLSVSALAAAKTSAAAASTLSLANGTLKLMAWIKLKTAIIVGVSVVVAAGATTVVVKELAEAQSSPPYATTIPESAWMSDHAQLEQLPPVLVLRHTQYPNNPGGIGSNGRLLYRNQPLSLIFAAAYGDIASVRWLNKELLPTPQYNLAGKIVNYTNAGFDLLLTLTNKPIEALRSEVKRQFGIVGRPELRETNILFLKVKNPNAPNLTLAPGKGAGVPLDVGAAIGFGFSITNAQIESLRKALESELQQIVFDKTGLTNYYNIHLTWDPHKFLPHYYTNSEVFTQAQAASVKDALLNQLGMELVPGTNSVEMLILEKVKK